jgi:glycine hydroxymethyltransferase
VSELIGAVADSAAGLAPADLTAEVERLAEQNRHIHDRDCLNLNPATNRMNPRAEALLAAGLGSRASLGYPGDKYETGLEAIERIEVIAAELAAEVFDARYAEVRVGSGALANLYAFMATCRPGDTIIAPPAEIAGHVTHQGDGAAGRYGLTTVSAPVDPGSYSVDLDRLRELTLRIRPALITVGGSLNLVPHPVAAIREIADEVGAFVLFDAAHLCGMIAGRAWPNPLTEGAHLLSMSTYKSLGGPAGGLLLTNEPELAERIEAIAYPGLTANFDAGRVAALAITLNDWRAVGGDYATAMVGAAGRLASELAARDVPVFAAEAGFTTSHQFAVLAAAYGGGQAAARRLRRANLLACGIGLPVDPVPGDTNGLRLGTPEVVRLGLTADDMPELADHLAAALRPGTDPAEVAGAVTALRQRSTGIAFTADAPAPAPAGERPLTWLGGNPGDGWYEMTEGLLPLLTEADPELRLTLRAGGGEQNLTDIQAGAADLGLSIDIVVSAAVNGGAPFAAPLDRLACLGTGWSPLPYNVLQAEDAPIDFDKALTGDNFRVGVPPLDTTDELTFQRIVEHLGSSYDQIAARGGTVLLDGYDALVRALGAGEIDYVFGATTLPAPSIARAGRLPRAVRLAPLSDDLTDLLARRYGCVPGRIPAGTYPGLQHGDVPTAFVDTVFVCAATLDEDLAHRITVALLTAGDRLADVHPSLARFNPRTAWRNTPAPLHPGAARAYRELGLLS